MPDSMSLPVVERCLDGARLVLPLLTRRRLGDDVEISADLVGCVLISPPGMWEEALPQLRECSAASHHAEELFRFYAASETRARVDERGRLSIPRLHLEWAGLSPDGQAILIAFGRALQVWSPVRLDTYLRVANRQLRSLPAHILREQLSLIDM